MQDYFFHKEGVNNGGNRYATVLTYLNDVEEGGETVSDGATHECCRSTSAIAAAACTGQALQTLTRSCMSCAQSVDVSSFDHCCQQWLVDGSCIAIVF